MLFRKRHKSLIGPIAGLALISACTVAPTPIDDAQHIERSQSDIKLLQSIEFVPAEPITLHEAMARAVAFNLKRRVSQIESHIAEAELEQGNYEMLPALELGANRNRNSVKVSSDDDRNTKSADASFTWNLLDLGVSYARAKQRADEVLIARERERKALQDIIRQVNTAFWRAATGERLIKRVGSLARDLKFAMAASRKMEATRATDVISAVAFRRDIVESVRQALSVQRELREAKTELAELLNIRPGTDFTLVAPATRVSNLRLPMSIENMERHALQQRPELRIEDYNERISEWQAREALYGMLPGLDMSLGSNYSSESSNLSANWISTGLNLGMNIFGLFSGNSKIEAAEQKGELARQQRLAMSLAVLTQLHIAHVKYRHASQQMRLVKEIADSDRHLAQLVGTRGQFLNKNYFEAVSLATRQLNSEMDEQRTLVELVTSHAEVMHAIGLDVLPERVSPGNISALTNAIQKMTATWISTGHDTEPAPIMPMDQLVSGLFPDATRPTIMTAEATPANSIEIEDDDSIADAGGHTAKTDLELILTDDEPEEVPAGPTLTAEAAVVDPRPVAPTATADVSSPATPPRDVVSEIIVKNDLPSAATAQVIEQLNKIAPASRGYFAPEQKSTTDLELLPMPSLLPSAPSRPESSPNTKSPHFVVSLGAFRRQGNAFKLHEELLTRPENLFGDNTVRVVLRPSENGTTYYFVQSDPIQDRDTAKNFCKSIKRAGRDCHVSSVPN